MADDNLVLDRLDVQDLADQKPRDAIRTLYGYVVAGAEKAIRWYDGRTARKARASRGLRAGAIALSILGGLAPLLAGLVEARVFSGLSQVGYILLALAAGCVLADRFFGFSSAWMRYITTFLVLERQLADFRLDWAGMLVALQGREPTGEEMQEFVVRARTFQAVVLQLVEKETESWVSEFRSNIAELERLLAQQKEAARKAMDEVDKSEKAAAEARKAQDRKGALNITVAVPAGAAIEGPVALMVDDKVVQRAEGRTFAVRDLPPGLYAVGVSAKVNGKDAQSSVNAEVKSGQITPVTVSLGG